MSKVRSSKLASYAPPASGLGGDEGGAGVVGAGGAGVVGAGGAGVVGAGGAGVVGRAVEVFGDAAEGLVTGAAAGVC